MTSLVAKTTAQYSPGGENRLRRLPPPNLGSKALREPNQRGSLLVCKRLAGLGDDVVPEDAELVVSRTASSSSPRRPRTGRPAGSLRLRLGPVLADAHVDGERRIEGVGTAHLGP